MNRLELIVPGQRSIHDVPSVNMLEFVMANRPVRDRRLPEEELARVRVIVPPDPSGRVFEDYLDPGTWYSTASCHQCWFPGTKRVTRSAAAGDRAGGSSMTTDGTGTQTTNNRLLGLPDVRWAAAQAREYLRSFGYPAAGWPSS